MDNKKRGIASEKKRLGEINQNFIQKRQQLEQKQQQLEQQKQILVQERQRLNQEQRRVPQHNISQEILSCAHKIQHMGGQIYETILEQRSQAYNHSIVTQRLQDVEQEERELV